MSCGKNDYCKSIADDYANKINELESEFSNLNQVVNNITISLSSLNIPNDYLGMKVLNSIDGLKNDFISDKSSIDSCKSGAIGFANSKKSEHTDHYNTWLSNQDE